MVLLIVRPKSDNFQQNFIFCSRQQTALRNCLPLLLVIKAIFVNIIDWSLVLVLTHPKYETSKLDRALLKHL